MSKIVAKELEIENIITTIKVIDKSFGNHKYIETMKENNMRKTSQMEIALTFKNIFAKLKFSPALFEIIPHLLVWCLRLTINEFENCKICFLKKQADLKTNCTRLWRFVLMITYNMLTQKYYFC